LPIQTTKQEANNFNICRCLDVQRVSFTIDKLEHRIAERFPNSGLKKICQELHTISEETKQRADEISSPIWKVRVPTALAVLLVIILLLMFFSSLSEFKTAADSLSDFLQGFDGFMNGLFLVLMLILFLFTLENRLKRNKTIKALQELRAIAHVVDMHQLTKDPSYLLNPKAIMTPSSPDRSMSQFELIRYLDYCAELLALIGKLAGYYAQRHNDPVVQDVVNDIENLTNDLARKIWQKIAVISGH